MPVASPHPPDPRPRRIPAVLTLTLALLASSPSRDASGAADGKLPGSIPKSPALISGFPIPFHRTTDFRDRHGGVLPADLDNDGVVELVVSVPSGEVTVLRPDGSVRPGWPRTFESLPPPAFPVGPPTLGDLDGDGGAEIVSCVVGGGTPQRIFIFAFHEDGADHPGWPVEIETSSVAYPTCPAAGLTVSDLDADGRAEVVLSVGPGDLNALDDDGRPMPGWPIRLEPDERGIYRAINARPETADLDGNGRREIIIVEAGLSPRLMAVTWNGRILDQFHQRLDEVVDRQSPVAGDFYGDGGMALVQSTLPFESDFLGAPATDGEPTGDGPVVPAALHVLTTEGEPMPGWPRRLDSGGPWGSVLADLTGDGRLEIVQQDGDLVYAFDIDGGVVAGFPHKIHRNFKRTQALEMSPWLVSDLDDDGALDLLQTRSNVYLGSTYMRVFGIQTGGQSLKGFPFEITGHLAASEPVAVDLSGDGVADLVMLTTEGTNGRWSLMAWDLGSLLPSQ